MLDCGLLHRWVFDITEDSFFRYVYKTNVGSYHITPKYIYSQISEIIF